MSLLTVTRFGRNTGQWLQCNTFTAFARHLSLNKLSSPLKPMSPKVCEPQELESDITHNLNALKIVDSANGYRFYRDDLSLDPIDSRPAIKAFFNFLIVCPHFYIHEKYKIDKLLKHLPKLTENHAIIVLKAITSWHRNESKFEPIIRKVIDCVDNQLALQFKCNSSTNSEIEMVDRYNRCSFVANLFFRLQMARQCKFNRLLIGWVAKRQINLTKGQLLELFFYVNIIRDVDSTAKDYLERQTQRHISDMTLEEMSVVCMTFFKIKHKMSDNLMRAVIKISLESISDETNSYVKTDVLKAITFSYDYVYKQEVYHLIQRYKQLDNNVFCLIRLINLLERAKIDDKLVFDKAFDILRTNPKQFLPKYIERLLFCAEELNYGIDSQIISTLSQHIINNISDFDENLCNILSHFASIKFFPKQLIEHCFQQKFLDRIEKTLHKDFQTSLLKLNSCLAIEKFDEFSHLLLDKNRVNRLRVKSMECQDFWSNNKSQRRQVIQQFCQRVNDCLSSVGRTVHLCYVFPFDVQPIVAVKPNDCYSDINLDNLVNCVLREGMFENWTSISVLHLTDYSTYQRTRLTATVLLRNRLLDRLGFRTIALSHKQVMRALASRQDLDRLVATLA